MKHKTSRVIFWPATFAGLFVLGALGGCDAKVQPMEPIPETTEQVAPLPELLRWSDPSAWPAGSVPTAGLDVSIPKGVRILLDVSPPALGALDIQGTLEFDRSLDLELRAEWIRVEGALRLGTEEDPHPRRVRIVLTGPSEHEALAGMGNRLIAVVPGGQFEVAGQPRKSWTQLDASAWRGAQEITVATAVDWQVGDRIVIAASGFNPLEAEDRVITAITGRRLTLDRALAHDHYGEIQVLSGHRVDQRAEVGLLSRNIVIQGAGLGEDEIDSDGAGFGGHIILLGGAIGRISNVELVNMGQSGLEGHYPIHWHMAGNVQGQFFRNNVVWRSNNRCVTIHGTRNLVVEKNVCYDHLGHGYFIEEGAEVGNQLIGNLGVLTRRPPAHLQVIPSDERPSTFWVTNPENQLVDNVAAGSEGFGFWLAFPESPIGLSAGVPLRPNHTPLGEFRGNVAHSNERGGFFIGDGPDQTGRPSGVRYNPRITSPNGQQAEARAYFKDLLAYKNRARGIWLEGSAQTTVRITLTDNEIASTFAASHSYMEDSFVAARTANPVGQQELYRGFEFYDGPLAVRRTVFWGFSGRGSIPWSALGFNRFVFGAEPSHEAEDLRFVNSRRFFLDEAMRGHDGELTAAFRDVSGSITGTRGAWITGNFDFLKVPGCEDRPDWNAMVCPGPYLRVHMSSEYEKAFTPLRVTRGDGVAMDFHGGFTPDHSNVTVMPGFRYDFELTHAPGNLNIYLQNAKMGDWVILSLPMAGTPPVFLMNHGHQRVEPASSLWELETHPRMAFWHDSAKQRLHLRLQVEGDQHVWAQVNLRLTINSLGDR
jgi:cell migration-inducing and hyaluronan-binding protein